jgi:hypothetical protein
MSVSFGCRCAERRKRIGDRAWVVVTRNGSNSAFNGYRWAHSDYSEVYCRKCRALGRTKASYVKYLPNGRIG